MSDQPTGDADLAAVVEAQQAAINDLIAALAVTQRTVATLSRRVAALERARESPPGASAGQ